MIMPVKNGCIIGGTLFLALSALIFFVKINPLSPFVYTESSDFYSYISLDNSSYKNGKVVVPFGVFSVEKEGAWVHVARMDVSVVECGLVDGKRNEGTVYKNRLEYWALNINENLVFGPMNKSENEKFIFKNGLTSKPVYPPESYSKYLNNFASACI